METIWIELVLIVVGILANGFFAGSEIALVSARVSRLSQLRAEGVAGAAEAIRLKEAPESFLATIQIAITLVGTLASAVGGATAVEALTPWLAGLGIPGLDRWAGLVALSLVILAITYLSLVLGELVPKAIALTKNEETALWVALPIEGVYIVSYPVVWFFQASANAMTRLVGIEPAPAGIIAHSEEEIRMIVAQAEVTGEIEEDEREMLYKVFDFADKEVSDVMVPRPEVVALSIDLPPEECLAAAMEAPYTRYPVYRDSLDTVIGILHVRDLMRAVNANGRFEDVDVESLLRPAHVVPETKDLAALLHDFRRVKEHMAVVVDEYGAMEGIVTLEDVLEEIVGEIEDEFDLPDTSVERIDENRIRIEGTYTIDDFNEEFHTDLEQEDFHTMAGLVFGELGRAPEVGDTVNADGLRLSVLEVEGSRILKIEVEFGVDETPTDEPAAA
jgi:putative hemolysin